MLHQTPLIATIVGGLVLAFLMGSLAHRLKVSPLVGYLLAGVVVGTFTPGFVADQALALELAEIGVILLMFGVGLHFSLKDLLAVKAIAIPGAVVQIAIATILGIALALGMGWPVGSGIVFGLALSVASTVVLLRALQERRLLDTDRGRIAVGWLIVEDLAMVLTLVLLPPLAGLLKGDDGQQTPLETMQLLEAIGITLAKVIAFIALMLIVGRRVIPWILHYTAHSGSRELFRLGVLAIALGVAYGSAMLFGVSFALGAFFAGMVLSESELSHQAASDTLPLRDAFAVLFFVSVGMLFNPAILVTDFWPLMATFLIIVVGKSLAALAIVRLFRHPLGTAFTISASLAQIGEFSFILAGLGVALGLMPERGRDLILAGAILSILANPAFFYLLNRLKPYLERREALKNPAEIEEEPPPETPIEMEGHIVLIGFGRVGRIVGAGLKAGGLVHAVIEERLETVTALRAQDDVAIQGNGADAGILATANLAKAKTLVVAIPDAFEAGQIVSQARILAPDLLIVARAHSDAEVEHLERLGANLIIMGEREIAHAMLARLIPRAEVSAQVAG